MSSGNVGDGGKGALARQLSSIYSLTFDEFQSTLGVVGKDFGSMNMDELLRSICTADDGHVAAAKVVGEASGLKRQGSFTLSRTLSQKTVDEVWRGFVMEGGIDAGGDTSGAVGFRVDSSAARQPTLGEITLEDFLVRAGVVREGVDQATTNGISSTITTPAGTAYCGGGIQHFPRNPAEIDLGFPSSGSSNGHKMPSSISFPQEMKLGGVAGIQDQGYGNVIMQNMGGLPPPATVMVPMAVGSPANQMASDGLSRSNGEFSSSPVTCVFGQEFRGRKNSAVEKVVERRQRRMIKNRESAARSRARKQAYTIELEAEVSKLKEQNLELRKKQAELVEINKFQVLELLNQQHGIKRQCLRRTLTGP